MPTDRDEQKRSEARAVAARLAKETGISEPQA
jgi:hypothetical protein